MVLFLLSRRTAPLHMGVPRILGRRLGRDAAVLALVAFVSVAVAGEVGIREPLFQVTFAVVAGTAVARRLLAERRDTQAPAVDRSMQGALVPLLVTAPVLALFLLLPQITAWTGPHAPAPGLRWFGACFGALSVMAPFLRGSARRPARFDDIPGVLALLLMSSSPVAVLLASAALPAAFVARASRRPVQ